MGSRRTVVFFAALPILALASAQACGQSTAQLPPETPDPLDEGDGLGGSAGADGENTAEAEATVPEGPRLPWAESTFSPRPGSSPEPDLEEVVRVCGRGDAALHATAADVAAVHQAAGEAPTLDLVKFHLHRHGSPYVMPRLWSATMRGVSPEELVSKVESWASSRSALGEFRCGAGLAEAEDGTLTVSVLQADVLAEMRPLPTQVESGQWLQLDVAFLAPTTAASVVLLPPEGAPRTLRTKGNGSRAQAKFAIETSGTWLVQVMATQTGGPRPVAEALITADDDPPSSPSEDPVPGEEAFDAELGAADALFELMNAAREDAGLPLLRRNRGLDLVARAHSDAMLAQGRISHNTGQGDPARRVEMAGLSTKATGENVALAQSVLRLHRVLWASPSHRGNLLLRRWDQAGVAISTREDGTLFATQLFADKD